MLAQEYIGPDRFQWTEAQVREGYCHNPVAQRAVKLVSEGVGSTPVRASDPALAALATARSGGQVLIETVAAHLLLHGRLWRDLIWSRRERLPLQGSTRRQRAPSPVHAGWWALRPAGRGPGIRMRSQAGPVRAGFSSNHAKAWRFG